MAAATKPKTFRARVTVAGGRRVRVDVRMPELVGVTAAAEMLGVPKSHISRLRGQGRMPQPVPVEGSADVWIRSEVAGLAEEMNAARAARAATPRPGSRAPSPG